MPAAAKSRAAASVLQNAVTLGSAGLVVVDGEPVLETSVVPNSSEVLLIVGIVDVVDVKILEVLEFVDIGYPVPEGIFEVVEFVNG